MKQASWLRDWRERQVAVKPAPDATSVSALEWSGGRAPGILWLHNGRVWLKGDQMIVTTGGWLPTRTLHFRATPDGPPLEKWVRAGSVPRGMGHSRC